MCLIIWIGTTFVYNTIIYWNQNKDHGPWKYLTRLPIWLNSQIALYFEWRLIYTFNLPQQQSEDAEAKLNKIKEFIFIFFSELIFTCLKKYLFNLCILTFLNSERAHSIPTECNELLCFIKGEFDINSNTNLICSIIACCYHQIQLFIAENYLFDSTLHIKSNRSRSDQIRNIMTVNSFKKALQTNIAVSHISCILESGILRRGAKLKLSKGICIYI